MSHHSSSVNGEGTSHKDPLSRILDELSSLKLWKEKQERKEKGKNNKNHTSWQENKYPEKKRVKGKCACCFGSKFILQLEISIEN